MARHSSIHVGLQIGKLHVMARGPLRNGNPTWKCVCECEKIKTVLATNLLSGRTQSCGDPIHRSKKPTTTKEDDHDHDTQQPWPQDGRPF